MNNKKISVMLLDDHPAIRYGLAMAIDLEDDMGVAVESSDAENAINILAAKEVDVVLVDISLDGHADGFDFIKAVHERYSSVRMLVLSMYDEAFYAEKAILAGALGYMSKKEPVRDVIAGIREVFKGNIYLPGDISGKLILKLMKVGNKASGNSYDALTPRELEVLSYIGMGYAPIEIARELNLSVNTVETYRKHLKEKLGFATSRELFKYAIQKYKTGK